MEWSEFLNDYELNSGRYSGPPDGRLLFKKVIHDILECLTGYKECVKIATALKEDVPHNTLSWLLTWEAPINIWIEAIVSLDKQFGELPNASLEWPTLIAQVGKVLTRVPEMRKGVDVLVMPSAEKLQLAIQIAIRLTAKLGLIWNDIQAKEYKRLWAIQRYDDLIE